TMRELAGKTAFVTGGASGIGLALGRAFARAGMKVMLADIETDALARAVESLRGVGPDVRGVTCDVADPASVDRAAKAAYAAFRRVHMVCNNAGVAGPGDVGTRLSESARRRPKRYGPHRRPDPASPAGKLAAEAARLQQLGLEPADVAAHTLAAIRDEELYVFTHPEMRGEVMARFAAI